MQAMTRAQLESKVKRLETSLARSQTSLGREKTKNAILTQSLAAAKRRENATAGILRIVRNSVADTQPVFDSIAKAARQLIGGVSAAVTRLDGETLHLAAFTSTRRVGDETFRSRFPRPISQSQHGRAVRSRAPYVIVDTEKLVGLDHREIARARGYRSGIFVPMLRGKTAIGTISVTRREPGPFSDRDIDLLKTFADQAVIAINNARLFNEAKEALERQTAIADILRIISSSPTDTQPVFNAIVNTGVRLFNGNDMTLRLINEDRLETGATTRLPGPNTLINPIVKVDEDSMPAARAIQRRETVQIPDYLDAQEWVSDKAKQIALQNNFRAMLSAPLLREDAAIGVLNVTRATPGEFTDKQVALLKTFADQAVIALENVRLFRELGARNRDLTTALDQQTATSDILRVMSRSQTDVQPVFDAIVTNAVRLLRGRLGTVTRIVQDRIELAAFTSTDEAGDEAVRAIHPRPVGSATGPHGHAIRERVPFNTADAQNDLRLNESGRAVARARGYRSFVSVPMLHRDEPIGTVAVARIEAGGFTDDEIALLKTFADQAVIAIENVRLFNETKEALAHQAATADVLQVISRSPTDTKPVFDAIVNTGHTLLSGLDVSLRLVIGAYHELVASTLRMRETAEPFPCDDDSYPASRAMLSRELLQVQDILAADWVNDRVKRWAEQRGWRATVIAPMLRESTAIGVIQILSPNSGSFTDKQVALLKTFADQAVIAIENVRLFNEIQEKSRQVEIANRHKSEFLANMSHELRTPLNAVIGFSEILQQGMVGALSEKQTEYVNYIHTSGSHLLSLINDILDLSKVEAGRMELDVTRFSIPMAIDNALTLVKERATRHGLSLVSTIEQSVAEICADERKFKQILLNLLSNAVKFTPEGGQITVSARTLEGAMEVGVADTGIGIAPQDCDAVFEEFRQVGQDAERKAQGTGLGLALTKKFIELHGGRIWLKSVLGEGSTFFFTLPLEQPELQPSASHLPRKST